MNCRDVTYYTDKNKQYVIDASFFKSENLRKIRNSGTLEF